MSFYIKPKTEHARGAEPNYLYSHFSAVFPAESLTIRRAELNTALVYTCTCMYGLFPYLSTYMYIVLKTHTCKVMCEVWTTYGHKIVIFTLIEKKIVMRNELDTIPIRKSIYSGFYEKKANSYQKWINLRHILSFSNVDYRNLVNLFEPIVIRFTSIFKYIC